MAFDIGSVVAHVKADISDFTKGMTEVEKQVGGFKKSLDNVGDNLTSFGKKATLFMTTPIIAAGTAAIKAAADFEQLQVAMSTILGDSGAAAKLLADLKDFAAKTPFEFTDIAQATKQLLAYGFAQDEIIGTSRTLGDVAAGLNIPFGDLAYLYGTLRAQQVAYTKDMNQFANRGIPIWDELAKVMGKTVPEVRKLVEAGEVDFPLIQQAFANMTGEGGKFHNLMQAQSQTTAGQFSNLKDSIGFLARDIGVLLLPTAMQLIQTLRSLVEWVNGLSEGKKQLIIIIAAFVAAIGPVLIVLGFLVNGISAVISIASALGAVLTFLSANPIVLVIAAIVALIAIGIYLVKHWDDVKAAATKLGQWIAQKWEDLKNKLGEIGHKILDAIMWPFNEAKKRIEEAVNWIKDRLDFTKRHSPSVVDIVNKSVTAVNNALNGLASGASLGPMVTSVGLAGAGSQSSIANIRIDLAGAFITDEYTATGMGERLGDAIVKKLQRNVRV